MAPTTIGDLAKQADTILTSPHLADWDKGFIRNVVARYTTAGNDASGIAAATIEAALAMAAKAHPFGPPTTIGDATLYLGDCLDVLRTLPDASVDSVVTDPPYGLSFMGKRWDYDVPSVEIWAECLRVLKPGGHLLAFAGTRTQHRMAVRIEDAGFEIRDMLAWLYGSGFPKSLDVSKAIDAQAGAEREVVGIRKKLQSYGDGINNVYGTAPDKNGEQKITAPSTDAAKQWDGWGTALKPALEPITLARKPLAGTVAANVLAHGTGGLNIAACRIDHNETLRIGAGTTWDAIHKHEGREGEPSAERTYANKGGTNFAMTPGPRGGDPDGRWPANVLHDGSDEVLAAFPQEGRSTKPSRTGGRFDATGAFPIASEPVKHDDDGGSAARFFYCAKASKADRDEGLELSPTHVLAMSNQAKAELAHGNMHATGSSMNTAKFRKNHHPTVKPTDLMRYLLRLVTPPGGTALDPFMCSGSTGKAALLEHFKFIGIERDPDYFEIAKARIDYIRKSGVQVGLFGEAA